MSTATRIPRAEAVEIANRFIGLLEGAYERLEIAGSIRRRLPTVGDLEIVAVPRLIVTEERDMFGEVIGSEPVDLLAARMTLLLDKGRVQQRARSDGKFFWGPSAKYLTFEGASIDLFTPEADRFAWILALRTGPADFSNALVTHQGMRTRTGRKGLLPDIYRSRDGWLTWRTSGERIVTREEKRLFEILSLPWQEPWERV